MAEHPAMPFWTDAYLGDTQHLTTTEHGAYLLLLISMWRSGGTLPDDDQILARYARVTPAQWRRMAPILRPFFRAADGVITQGRLTDELNAVRQHSTKQSDRAKARWRDKPLKSQQAKDATAMPAHTSGISRSDAGSMPPLTPYPLPSSLSTTTSTRNTAREADQPSDGGGGQGSGFAGGDSDQDQDREVGQDHLDVLLDAIGPPARIAGSTLGKPADRREAHRWTHDLLLTPDEQADVIRDVMAGSTNGPPANFAYFSPAMRRAAGQPERGPLTPDATRPVRQAAIDIGAIVRATVAATVAKDEAERAARKEKPDAH